MCKKRPGRSRVWEDSCEWPQVDAEAEADEEALSAKLRKREIRVDSDGGW